MTTDGSRSKQSTRRLGLGALFLCLCLTAIAVPDRADATVCFPIGPLASAGGLAGTGLLGIPTYTAPEGRLRLGVGGGTAGLGLQGALYGDWGGSGYQVETFHTGMGAGCGANYLGNLSVSFSGDFVDEGRHELRGLAGAGFNLGAGVTGPNLNLGLAYSVRIASQFRFGARLRYLPVFTRIVDNGPQYEDGAPAFANQFRSAVRLQWKAVRAFQPFVEVVGASSGPLLARRSDAPTRLFVTGQLGFQARWGDGE